MSLASGGQGENVFQVSAYSHGVGGELASSRKCGKLTASLIVRKEGAFEAMLWTILFCTGQAV